MMTPEKIEITEERPESLVRDHLANERTYLAWLRTGIALLGLGFVIAKLGVEFPTREVSPYAILHSGTIALIFALAGLMVVGFGTWRFMETEQMLRRKNFRPLGPRALLISAAFLLIGLAVLIYLLSRQ